MLSRVVPHDAFLVRGGRSSFLIADSGPSIDLSTESAVEKKDSCSDDAARFVLAPSTEGSHDKIWKASTGFNLWKVL